jgi:DNA-binding MarR family transcriptional regulator
MTVIAPAKRRATGRRTGSAAVRAETARATSRNPVSAYPGDPLFYRGDDFKAEESIGYLLRTLRLHMDRAIDDEMATYDLTGVQWRPLLAIHLGMGDTAAELARVGCVDTGAMTRMLDRLEAKGLVQRTPCPNDARVMRLALTTEGERLCRQIPYGLSRVMNSVLRGFKASELATLKSMVRRMLANAESW